MKQFLEEKGSVMLEYVAVCFAVLVLSSVCGLFNPFARDGGYLNKAFAEHYQVVAKAISLPYP